jgi:hypothetical protein
MPVYRREEMKSLLVGVCFVVSLLSLVSCGDRSESSFLKTVEVAGNDKLDLANIDKVIPTEGDFPHKPHPDSTPGSLCQKSDTLRYPEKIKYCKRNVDKEQKRERFEHYDREYGYHTTEMERSQFKIDHLVPLCMGGSNESDNLWPQHRVIYENTDPLEPFLCETLAAGKVKQAEAVRILLEIKQRPFDAPEELRKLEARF